MLRILPALFLLFAGCAHFQAKPVDVANLPPLSGKERALLAAGDGAWQTGNAVQAEQNYQSAVAASVGHVDAHIALANLYLATNQRAKAEAVLARGLALQPKHPKLNHAQGKLLIEQGKPGEALSAFKRGLESAPGDLDLLSAAGIASDMERKHAVAQSFYLRALATNPNADLTAVKTNLAMSYLLSSQPQRAADLLKEDAQKPGASPVTRHNLALAYGMLGKHQEAKQLVKGEMSEEERKLSIKRLEQYIAQRDTVTGNVAPPPNLAPLVHKEAK